MRPLRVLAILLLLGGFGCDCEALLATHPGGAATSPAPPPTATPTSAASPTPTVTPARPTTPAVVARPTPQPTNPTDAPAPRPVVRPMFQNRNIHLPGLKGLRLPGVFSAARAGAPRATSPTVPPAVLGDTAAKK